MFSGAILVTVLVYTWVAAPLTSRSAVAIPTFLVVALSLARAAKTGEWGVQGRTFLGALAWSMAFTAFAALAMYVAAARLGTWHGVARPWATLAVLLPWGLGQQFALQTVFLREAQALTSSRRGILIAAAMFAALHFPNPFLTVATATGAIAWCWIYDRYRNVLPLMLSHAILTLVILGAFNDAITGRLRVGLAYLSLR